MSGADSTVDRRGIWRPLLAVVLLVVVIAAIWALRDSASMERLVEQEARLVAFRDAHPWQLAGLLFVVYAAVTALSLPPGAWAYSLACAWLLGFWRGLLVVSFASTLGATLAFLLSRYLLRDWVAAHISQRFPQWESVAARDGAYWLFALRLAPIVPFFAINLLSGLTSLRVNTFWWVSQLGMLPGTAVYVYAGASLPTLAHLGHEGTRAIVKPELLIALIALGLFPIVARWLLRRWRGSHFQIEQT